MWRIIITSLIFALIAISIIGCDTVTTQPSATIGQWPSDSPVPQPGFIKSSKSNTDLVPPKDSWNFKVQTSTYAYYANFVWKAGTDTIIKDYWSGRPNKWDWKEGYLVFTKQAYGDVSILPQDVSEKQPSGVYSATQLGIKQTATFENGTLTLYNDLDGKRLFNYSFPRGLVGNDTIIQLKNINTGQTATKAFNYTIEYDSFLFENVPYYKEP